MDGTPFGRYRLIELLGRGGVGEVWRAYDPTMDRVVALKVLPQNFAGDQVFKERFRREARMASGLDDPHTYRSRRVPGSRFLDQPVASKIHDMSVFARSSIQVEGAWLVSAPMSQ